MSPTEILLLEHRWIESMLACLERLASPEQVDSFDTDGARRALDFLASFADTCHHGKEEDHLFDAMVRRGFPERDGPIAVMNREHEQGRDLLRHMSEAVEDFESETDRTGALERFASHAASYVHLMRAHIAKENTCLFKMADGVLDADATRTVLDGFARFEEELFGVGAKAELIADARYLAEKLNIALPAETPFVAGLGALA